MSSHPRNLPGYIGQQNAVNIVTRQIAGARRRGEPAPNMLFTGPSGIGKTEFTRAIAASYGTNMLTLTGDRPPAQISAKLGELNACDFLFCDEAHNLKPATQEIFYQAIDDGRVREVASPGGFTASGSSDSVELKPFTLILASDQPGKLNNALIKRIQLTLTLDFYSVREMQEIVVLEARRCNVLLAPPAARLLASVSGGLPRMGIHYVQNLRRHVPESEEVVINREHVVDFMRAHGIDRKGFRKVERDYLGYLKKVKRASIDTIANCLGLDADYIRRQIEPQLVQRTAFVAISSSGRVLTAEGKRFLLQTSKRKRNRE